MMLQGEAKRDYMRDYMRRKRAGEPTAKPKPEWQPTQRQIDEVHWWFRCKLGNRRINGIGAEVVDGLDPNNADGTANDAAWNEAMQRYKALRDQQRADRKAKAAREAADRNAPPCCMFCLKPKTAKRHLVGDGYRLICARCNNRITAMFAKLHKAR